MTALTMKMPTHDIIFIYYRLECKDIQMRSLKGWISPKNKMALGVCFVPHSLPIQSEQEAFALSLLCATFQRHRFAVVAIC